MAIPKWLYVAGRFWQFGQCHRDRIFDRHKIGLCVKTLEKEFSGLLHLFVSMAIDKKSLATWVNLGIWILIKLGSPRFA